MAVLSHEGTYSILFGSWPIPVGASHRTCYLSRPDRAGRFPTVLVVPSIAGLTSLEKEICRHLARNGMAALAFTFYTSPPDDPLAAYARLSDEHAQAEMDEVYEFLSSPDTDWMAGDRLGILGIDVGGRFALIAGATRSWTASVAVCYSPLTGDEGRDHQVADYLGSLPVPVLGCYGADDELIALETVDEAQRRNAHGQWLLYEGAGHGFLDIDSAGYDASGAADVMARTVAFYKATLPAAQEEDLG